MRVLRMEFDEVQQSWPRIGSLFDDMPRLLHRLEANEAGLYRIMGTDAYLVMAAGPTKDTGARALWVLNLAGQVSGRPKANLRLMGEVFADCEAYARASQCTLIRIEPGTRSDWKLRLLPRFGFEALRVYGHTIMQKAVI